MNARGTLPLFDTHTAQLLSHKNLIHGLQQLASQTALLLAVLSQREQCTGNEFQHRDGSKAHFCFSDPGHLPAKSPQQPHQQHDKELRAGLQEESVRTGMGDSSSIALDNIQLPQQTIVHRRPGRKVSSSSAPSTWANTAVAGHGKEMDARADGDQSPELPPQMQLMRQFASDNSLSEDLRSRVRKLYRGNTPPTCVKHQDSLDHHHGSSGEEFQQTSFAVGERFHSQLVDRIGDDLWESEEGFVAGHSPPWTSS